MHHTCANIQYEPTLRRTRGDTSDVAMSRIRADSNFGNSRRGKYVMRYIYNIPPAVTANICICCAISPRAMVVAIQRKLYRATCVVVDNTRSLKIRPASNRVTGKILSVVLSFRDRTHFRIGTLERGHLQKCISSPSGRYLLPTTQQGVAAAFMMKIARNLCELREKFIRFVENVHII